MGESAPITTLIGRTVGNYEVVSKLGEGGMGAVYLARHPRIGKQVALKVLHAEFSSDPNIVDRFFTEAKSVNDIQHPNIVDIIDYGELPGVDGKPMVYFIMEFLEGQSVSDLIADSAPLDPERAFRISAQIADALAASHRHKVVHRDLKPDNIFLIQRGRQADFVKVLDFGIAKLTGDQPGSRRTRTDVYALGVVLFELITGRVPFEGEGYGEILVQHLTQPPPRPGAIRPGLSPYVEVVCLKALEKKRDNRYPSMEEFQAALLDPVTYVDQRGGVQGFLTAGANVRPGSEPAAPPGYAPPPGHDPRVTPMPPAMAVPPGTPIPPGTPVPIIGGGALRSDATPFPQSLPVGAQTPTPPPGYVDDLPVEPPRSRAPLFVVLGLLAAAALAAALFALGGGDGAEPADEAPATPPAVATGDEEATAPTPPEAARVELVVASSPTGAEVFVGDEKAPRGTTPATLQLDRSADPLAIRLVKEGYEVENKSVTPDRDVRIDVDLTPLPKVVAGSSGKKKKRTKKKKKKSGRDKTNKTKKKKRPKFGDDILVPEL